jgi:hypothetical protein
MAITIFITFVLAIASFHFNHQLKKFNDIRIIINTLFEVYGKFEAFVDNDIKDTNHTLAAEILAVEKLHDSNEYISEQVQKLRQLRHLYFKHSSTEDIHVHKEDIEREIKEINFKRLKRGFTLLAYLNIKP